MYFGTPSQLYGVSVFEALDDGGCVTNVWYGLSLWRLNLRNFFADKRSAENHGSFELQTHTKDYACDVLTNLDWKKIKPSTADVALLMALTIAWIDCTSITRVEDIKSSRLRLGPVRVSRFAVIILGFHTLVDIFVNIL